MQYVPEGGNHLSVHREAVYQERDFSERVYEDVERCRLKLLGHLHLYAQYTYSQKISRSSIYDVVRFDTECDPIVSSEMRAVFRKMRS
jgi:hypothetical protein